MFYDRQKQRVLLFLRDDKPDIPFPNTLDILGGEVEEGETPEQGQIREMSEEVEDKRTGLPLALTDLSHFKTYVDENGTEQTIFYVPANFAIDDVILKEGQRLVWITEGELADTPIAFGFAGVLKEFFQSPVMMR